jgi:hypothetical protein
MSELDFELIDIKCEVHAETDKALLVSDDGDGDNARWLPKSQIEWARNNKTGMTTVTMPYWLAEREWFV